MTVTDRIIAYLKKVDRWVPKHEIIRASENAGVGYDDVYTALDRIENTANIGTVYNKEKKVREYRYYEPREGDDLMQKALDEF
jgi:hypothetical protein